MKCHSKLIYQISLKSDNINFLPPWFQLEYVWWAIYVNKNSTDWYFDSLSGFCTLTFESQKKKLSSKALEYDQVTISWVMKLQTVLYDVSAFFIVGKNNSSVPKNVFWKFAQHRSCFVNVCIKNSPKIRAIYILTAVVGISNLTHRLIARLCLPCSVKQNETGFVVHSGHQTVADEKCTQIYFRGYFFLIFHNLLCWNVYKPSYSSVRIQVINL